MMNRREWDYKNGIGVPEIMGMRMMNRREWDYKNGIGVPEIMDMRMMNRREWDYKNGIGVPEIMGMRLMNRREWDNKNGTYWWCTRDNVPDGSYRYRWMGCICTKEDVLEIGLQDYKRYGGVKNIRENAEKEVQNITNHLLKHFQWESEWVLQWDLRMDDTYRGKGNSPSILCLLYVSTTGPCSTIIQISRTPRHWKLQSTIAQPNRPWRKKLIESLWSKWFK